MKLNPNRPIREQIKYAKDNGIGFAYDLRGEAMGDKVASAAVVSWLLTSGIPKITVIESEAGRTKFMLRDYFPQDDRVTFEVLDPYAEHPCLDLQNEYLWELNAYLACAGIRPCLSLSVEQPESSGDYVVFAIRTHATYDQRKDMDLDCATATIDALTARGYKVEVLYDRFDPEILEAKQRTLDECVQLIANCKAFIGGDTGFSHVAAGFGKPQVAIYPDYFRFGKASMVKLQKFAEWWGLPDALWSPFNSLPNARELKFVELGTDHKWSKAHVCAALESLVGRSPEITE